jgi:hypothetical protein
VSFKDLVYEGSSISASLCRPKILTVGHEYEGFTLIASDLYTRILDPCLQLNEIAVISFLRANPNPHMPKDSKSSMSTVIGGTIGGEVFGSGIIAGVSEYSRSRPVKSI